MRRTEYMALASRTPLWLLLIPSPKFRRLRLEQHEAINCLSGDA